MATLPDLMNGWQAGAPPSAMLAMRTLHAAQRFTCLACLQQVLPRLANSFLHLKIFDGTSHA